MKQGGYYVKGFAKHGPLHNPRAYGYFGPIAYRGPKRGGHVTPGGIIYKGDAFPPSYRGTFIGGNLLSNAVYWHVLERDGSTFAGRHGGTLIDARDRWFRPIDLLAGPDAAVYVVDWYDKRAAHLDPRDTWDRTNGRIYRVVYGDRRKLEPFDLSKRTSAELVALRTSTNDWFPAEARRILAERRDATIVPELKRLLAADRDETVALRDLWALHVSGGFDDQAAMELLDHRVPGVRRWTIRLLGDDHRMNPGLRDKLEAMADSEADAMVRSQIASSGQRWETRDALPILGRLARRTEDVGDPHIPNLLWWAFERQLRQDRDAVVNLLCTSEMQRASLVEKALLDRVARALVSEGSDGDFAACARLLAAAPGKEQTARLLDGMEQGLRGRTLAHVPGPMAGPLSRLWAAAQPAPGLSLIRLAARMGSPTAIAAAVDLARDPRTAGSTRAAMIELLGQVGRAEDLPVLAGLLEREASPTIQLAAVGALGGYARTVHGRAAARALSFRRTGGPRANPRIALHASGGGKRACWTRSSIGGSPPRT